MHQPAQVVSWMQRLQSLDLEACPQETMQCSGHELSWFQMQQLWTAEVFLLSTSHTPESLHKVSCGSATACSRSIPSCSMPQFRVKSDSTKRLYVCVVKEKGTCRSVGCALTWTSALDDANHPSATCPSTDSILKATCRKRLGALGAWGHCISLMSLSWITSLKHALQVSDFRQSATLKPHCKSFLRLVYLCYPDLADIACRLAGSTQVSSNSCELKSLNFCLQTACPLSQHMERSTCHWLGNKVFDRFPKTSLQVKNLRPCLKQARSPQMWCPMKGLRRMLRLSGQCWPRKLTAFKIPSVWAESMSTCIYIKSCWMWWRQIGVIQWSTLMTCHWESPLW